MKYNITYTKRKTVAIYVRPDGSVEIRCNKNTPISAIDRFVEQSHDWIDKKVSQTLAKHNAKKNWLVNVGTQLLFMGKEYSIIAKEGKDAGFDGENFYIPPNLDSAYAKQCIIKIYKQLAKKVISHRVIKYQEIMNVTPINVKISSAKTRWGSCSGKNSLNFSWLLIMADESTIDYIIVHELAHIREHNHSLKFWAEVKKIIPDYKLEHLKLKKLQKKLAYENWGE